MVTGEQSETVLRFLSAEAERQTLDTEDEEASVYFELPYGDYTWAGIVVEIEQGTSVGLRYVQKLTEAAAAENMVLEEFLGLKSAE